MLSAFAQVNMIDVVFLKNGSIIRGVIMEQVPNESLKIKTADGSIFVYKMDEVEKIAKEEGQTDKTLYQQFEEEAKSARKGFYPKEGYKGFFNLDYNLLTGDFKGTYNFGISTVHGYQLNPYVFAGGGVGAQMWATKGANRIDFSFPLFADIRLTVLKNWISPFAEMRLGYTLGSVENEAVNEDFSYGTYFNIFAGVRIGYSKSSAVNVGIGYQLQRMESLKDMDYDYYTGNMVITKGTVNCNAICLRVCYEW